MANWTVATTLERLGEILKEENIISDHILRLDADEDSVTLEQVVEIMKERIVKDQFTPKGKAKARASSGTKSDGS